MKTPFFKRAIAFVLAALMILGTLGYLFSTIAYGATTINGNDVIRYSIKEKTPPVKPDDVITLEVVFTVSDEDVKNSLESDDIEIFLNEDSFEETDSSNYDWKSLGGAYTATLENIKYTGNGRTITFTMINTTTGIACATVTKLLDASKFQEIQEEPAPEEPEPDPVDSNIKCTLWKIQTNKSDESRYIKYDFNNDQKRNSAITQGDLVTFRIQITDPDLTPEDIWDGGIGTAASKAQTTKAFISIAVDRGSFSPVSHTNASTEKGRDGSKYNIISVNEPNGEGNGVVYVVELTKLRYSGTGNTLGFTIKSKNDEQHYLAIHQEEITQCKETEIKETTSEPEPDDPDPAPMEMATPYVIINNYNYGGIITAGETFPLSVTLYNTSKNIDVQNMMVTITMPEAFMLTSSSNTFYIEELKKEASVTKTVDVTAKANADPQSHNIDISMKYQYVDDKINVRKDNTTQETISIPVVQVDRFQLTGVDVPMEIYVGEESYLSVNFVNKGRSEVYNLSAEISGDIQNPGQQQNLGNLASGATGTADFYITPNGEGVCTGEVLITYEDTNMEEKSATIQWSTNVVDPFAGMDFGGGFGEFDYGMMEDPSLMEGEQKSSLPFIAGGVGVAAVIAALVIRKRIQRKKREAEDADL